MKRNKAAKRWLRKRKRAVKGGLSKLIAISGNAPAEQAQLPHEPAATTNAPDVAGILRQDDNQFRLPNALAEVGELERSGWMPGGFVIFVIVSAIIFIAIIAWRVSEMPPTK